MVYLFICLFVCLFCLPLLLSMYLYAAHSHNMYACISLAVFFSLLLLFFLSQNETVSMVDRWCMGPYTTKVFGSDFNLVLFRRERGLAEWLAQGENDHTQFGHSRGLNNNNTKNKIDLFFRERLCG